MKPDRRSFDRLSGVYRVLEWLAFGADLERTRFGLLDSLRECRRVLVLGEGDGRFLARLVRRFPEISVDCLDSSAGMLARARARLTLEEQARVNFRLHDVRTAELGTGNFDAVVTLFFLDCFTEAEVTTLVARITTALRPDARWLWADFALPARGWRRWRAQVWVGGLYGFFRWQTELTARRLPPTEALLRAAGFAVCAERSLQAGLLRSAVFTRLASDH